jgi:hypothetical protein
MRRDQLEHAIRTACQIIGRPEVIVVGSAAVRVRGEDCRPVLELEHLTQPGDEPVGPRVLRHHRPERTRDPDQPRPAPDQARGTRALHRANPWFLGGQDEHLLGSLEVGRLGDVVVLSDDYFTVADEDLMNLHSVLTVLGGRVVHTGGIKYGA